MSCTWATCHCKGFGDTKIVPDIEADVLEAILKTSKAWKDDEATMAELWSKVKGPMFSLSDREKQLGLGQKGITTYFTPNCTNADSDLINRFFKHITMEGYWNFPMSSFDHFQTIYYIVHFNPRQIWPTLFLP